MVDKQMLRRIYALLDQVLDLPKEGRPAFMAALAQRDPLIADELRIYLEKEEEEFEIMESTSSGQATLITNGDVPPSETRGGELGERSLGRYMLVRELGRGGMGMVYLAESNGSRYAMKLLNQHRDADQAANRFERECQILARLDHRGIARFYESGVTEGGRAWLALEYVDGERIDRYCDARALDIHDRIELFLQACEAVSYAHNQLVIHRDLKPGNILVTRDGQVKLLDFGISMFVDEEMPRLTLPGQVLFTPECASPEQVRRKPVTVTTDVYALGVLLYRLLTGRHPSLDHYTTFDAMARAICEHNPTAPSKRVLELGGADAIDCAKRRGTTPARLSDRLIEDLDAIALKALAQRPEQRYASVQNLAEDLRRHLQGFPVAAKPPSTPYLLGKFLKRNRLTAIAVLFMVFLLISASLYAHTRSEQLRMERLGNQQLANFMIEMMGADQIPSRVFNMREALDAQAMGLSRRFGSTPRAGLHLCNLIGWGYISLGESERAYQVWEEGERMAADNRLNDEEEGLSLQLNLAEFDMASGRSERAAERLEAARDHRHFWTGDGPIYIRADLLQAELYLKTDRREAAQKQITTLLKRSQKLLGPKAPMTERVQRLQEKLR